MLARQLIVLLVICIFGATAHAQRASNWRIYKVADGLADSSVSSISISQRTNVWARHSDINTFSSLNGYRVRIVPAPGPGVQRLYESRVGQLWTVSPIGVHEHYSAGWSTYPIPEIQREFETNTTRLARPLSLVPLKQGRVLMLLSDQLAECSAEWPPRAELTTIRRASQTQLGKFFDMTSNDEGLVWISAEKGLARLAVGSRSITPDTVITEFIIPENLGVSNLQQPLQDRTGVTVIGESDAQRKKVAVHFDGQQWTVLPAARENIRAAWRTTDGTFWAMSIGALFYLEPGAEQFVESQEVAAARFFDVAVEANGAFWLGTSEGLFRYSPHTWNAPADLRHVTPLVQAISEDLDHSLWFTTPAAIYGEKDGRWTATPLPDSIELNPAGEGLFRLRDALILKTTDGLLRFHPKTKRFNRVTHPLRLRTNALGLRKDGTLCVQVFTNGTSEIQTYDGARFEALFQLPAQLATNELSFCFSAANNALWFGWNGGCAIYYQNEWQVFSSVDGSVPDFVLCMLETAEGKIWCGTRDRLWEFDGKNWTIVRSGFDRVNSITKAQDGSIWVASNSGLHRYLQGTWTVNSLEDGLPSAAIVRLVEDSRGRILAGTTRGLSIFHPGADTDAPATFVNNPTVSSDGSRTITFSGRDKWKFTQPDYLVFSHRLDEQEWSPYQAERSVTYPELSPGKHYFQVRAMDRNWNVDPRPALLEFEVPMPWYQETRLILISIVALAGIIFFAALAFNRHRQLLRSYAEVEKMVELRTKQVEEANAQLLHSQKMNALGTLAAGVAHDFNNILSIIKGSAQIIENNPGDAEKIQTRISRIKTVVDQGTGLVRAMLGFSRPAEKRLTMCQVNTLVTETVKLLGDRFQRRIVLTHHAASGLPQVPGSKNFVQQILLNFIFNASDALNGSGEIIVRTGEIKTLPQKLVLPPETAPSYVFISVQDFGSGIAPDIMPRIFEPFFTTKAFSVRRGTGLGLSMVYEMAKEMQSGLSVESIVGKGSTFTLIIPVRPLPIAPSTESGAPSPETKETANH